LIAYLEQAYSGLGNDGLLQRFQMLVYPDPIEWQYRDRHPNKEAFKAVLEIFSRLKESDFIELGAHPIDEYNKRPYFRFTLDAQAFYVDCIVTTANGESVNTIPTIHEGTRHTFNQVIKQFFLISAE